MSNVGSDETDETTNTGENTDEKTCASLDSEDPWFPPWTRRRAGQALAELDVARRAVTALCRAILDGFGVLQHVDAFVLETRRVLQPYVDSVAKTCERVAEKYALARGNVEKLAREFRKSSARRRERKRNELAAERARKLASGEFVEPDLPRFSELYWKRQGQRANALFGDLQMAIGGAYGAARTKAMDASRDASASFAATKHKFKTRVYPAWARVRLAVSREAVPVAAVLIETFPGKAEKALVAVAKALRCVGFVGYDDLAKVQSAKDFGLVLGDAFLALALSCGLVPALYFVVFRARPGDTRPDEATVEIKHVPANDGTFLGSHVGGGAPTRRRRDPSRGEARASATFWSARTRSRCGRSRGSTACGRDPPRGEGLELASGVGRVGHARQVRPEDGGADRLAANAGGSGGARCGVPARRRKGKQVCEKRERRRRRFREQSRAVLARHAQPIRRRGQGGAAVKAATSTRKKKASGANAEE